jgi:transcriptional antiterminator/mannitol/fructose-specific phosphotransferase system IIA component (Ntr-type)
MRGEGSVSSTELCDSLHLNRQLLMYYVRSLNETLCASGIPKVILEGNLLEIGSKGSSEIAKLIASIGRFDYVFVKEERQNIALLMMTLCSAPITISQLKDYFLVSRSTVVSDIAALRTMLEYDGLALVNLPHEGYRVDGDELALRWHVMDSFYRLDSVFARRAAQGIMLKAVLESSSNRCFFRQSCMLGSDEEVSAFGRSIENLLMDISLEVEEIVGEHLSYSMLGDLSYYLISVSLRDRLCPNGASELPDNISLALEGTPEWEESQLLIERLSDLGLDILPEERHYITALLRGARVFSLDDPSNERDGRAVELARLLVETFELKMCTTIAHRNVLLRRLLPHVRAMLYRMTFFIRLPGALAHHIIENYRQLYNVTRLVCRTVEDYIGVTFPPDEIAGLCVYFGSQEFEGHEVGSDLRSPTSMRRILVVCAAGIGTSLMVCQQLREILGQGFSYELCSIREFSSVEVSTFDLVVSTVDSPLLEKEVLRVSPVLTKSQERCLLDWSVRDSLSRTRPSANRIMDIIERYVDDKNALRLLGELSSYLRGDAEKSVHELRLLDILPASRIQVIKDEKSPEEAIRIGCEPLVRDGIITSVYADKILSTIDEFGLYMEYHRSILIAHAQPSIDNFNVGMSLTIFQHPFYFSSQDRFYHVLFTLSATDPETHIPAMRDLMALLSSEVTCETLRGWTENTPEMLYLYIAAQLSDRGS